MKLRIVEYGFADHQGVLANTIRVLVWDILSVLLFTHKTKSNPREDFLRQAFLQIISRRESESK